jgi:DNA modification methylase
MRLTVEQIVKNFVDLETIEYDHEYSRLAKIHKYWSRKPWFVIEKYISKYSKEKDLVLDPFCGSGLFGLEAILQNKNFVGYDLNPFAIFLAENTLNQNFDSKEFDAEFEQIKSDLKSKIMALYNTKFGYLLYAILGKKNSKKYNAVLSNENFKSKKQVYLEEKDLNPEVKMPKNLYFPDRDFPKEFYKDRFSYKGVSKVSHIFTKRNLLALALLYNELKSKDFIYRDYFYLAFTNTLLHVSKLKAENVRPLSVNNYWIPDDYIEENVWWRFEDRVKNVKIAKTTYLKRVEKSKNKSLGSYKLYNKSSLKMSEITGESVDYLITDPPYGDAIQYSELSFIWNTWLEKIFDTKEEVIINPVQNKGINEFNDQIQDFVNEAWRVLKNDGYFTLCFQNKNPKIWISIAEMIYHKGMKLVDISSYDTFGCPYNKNWAQFSPKSDFYVTFKKDKNISDHKADMEIKPEQIAVQIAQYLKKYNGKLFNLNKGYDLFVGVVIKKIFDGYKVVNYEKLTIKNIILMLEESIKYGHKQRQLF